MMANDWEAETRAEVDRICDEFRRGIAAARRSVAQHTTDVDGFLQTTRLFDGPRPEMVRADAFAEGARIFASRNELLRSVRLPAAPTVCEIGVWKGSFSKAMLRDLAPARLHLFDLRFDLLDPDVRAHGAVVLHEGDSAAGIATLADDSLDFAYVDGDHTYQGVRRDLHGVLPKVKHGGFIQVNDYTPWSVLSGFPYGVMANVNEILGRGLVKVVGFGWHPYGYHDVLLRKG